MKHYQKPDLSIYAFELDGSQDHLITEDMVPCEKPEPAPPPEPTYQELRAAEYPRVADGLDAVIKGGQALEDYRAACLAVKAKYPKP